MRFNVSAFLTTFIVVALSSPNVSAAPAPEPAPVAETGTTLVTRADANLEPHLISSNYYGAPIPPWKKGYHPGWYYGNSYDVAKHYGFGFVFPYLKDVIICKLYDLLPSVFHCPGYQYPPFHPKPPPPKYPYGVPPPPKGGDSWVQVFYGLDGAIEGDDYLTYGLVDTVDDCKLMCTYVDRCSFINTYHDVYGKNGSPLLTCALFSGVHGSEDAINKGGQTQPGGSINFITDGAGYYRY
ncbi:hypothetical protein K435DRAFT_150244 [Dendrothele bispora CBS 962.96]|uniref:Apple domain-containing protein n=1 Tax=Dendrothele bispora (strain CBS 962.96) TaxID=1314807 RepID=A0A4V4HI28_DENBC|nr:hypothetical protein K435DRAFT_150244 [Dendrothele bispora CBS 962.96]